MQCAFTKSLAIGTFVHSNGPTVDLERIYMQWSIIYVHFDFNLSPHDTIKRKDAALLPAPKTAYTSGEDSYAAGVQFSNTSLFLFGRIMFHGIVVTNNKSKSCQLWYELHDEPC